MSEARDSVKGPFDRFSAAISHWSQFGRERLLPEYSLLQRAPYLALAAPHRSSANGHCQLVRCKDDWVAINLPRTEDRDMVPALLEFSQIGNTWEEIHGAAGERSAQSLVNQGRLLGMALAVLGETVQAGMVRHDDGSVLFSSSAGGQRWRHQPRVVDLSALWAGPLCGALLAQAGCEVVKIESIARPDNGLGVGGTFSALLNEDKVLLRFDFESAHDRRELQRLLRGADIVITSARRRGLDSAGLSPEPFVHHQPSLVWLAITAHGLAGSGAEHIGFGDDCAVAGGLVVRDCDDSPCFLGDAIADPFTGLHAAAIALKALATRSCGIFDISLAHTAAMVNAMRSTGL